MCYYISSLIDLKTSLDDVNIIGEKFGITFEECNNDFVKSQLSQDLKYLIKNSSICDCGTLIGSLKKSFQTDQRFEKREYDSLKKKGWSDAKIKRWYADKKKIKKREERINQEYENREHSEIQDWLNFINTLFDKSNIEIFGLILHWYQQGHETERVEIKNIHKIKQSELSKEQLLRIEEDHIYQIEK